MAQRTISVNGERIRIITRRARGGGYNVTINGRRYYEHVLDAQEATDLAYVRWVKSQAARA